MEPELQFHLVTTSLALERAGVVQYGTRRLGRCRHAPQPSLLFTLYSLRATAAGG